MKIKHFFLFIIFVVSTVSANAQTGLSKKLENIPSLATIQELVSTFGKNFRIRREAWWRENDYELYYPEKGFGLLVSWYYVPGQGKEQRFIGIFFYPKTFPDSSYFGIPIKSAKKLKDFRVPNWKYNQIHFGDMGPVLRPLIGANSVWKNDFNILIYMPVIDSKYLPDPCQDYTVSNNITSKSMLCTYRIDLDVNGMFQSISTRRDREHYNLFRPIDYNSNKVIGNQLNRNIDRLFIIRESSFPPPEVDELKK